MLCMQRSHGIYSSVLGNFQEGHEGSKFDDYVHILSILDCTTTAAVIAAATVLLLLLLPLLHHYYCYCHYYYY